MKFKDNDHKQNYEVAVNIMKATDCRTQSVAYLLSLDNICFEHFYDIFDFAYKTMNTDSLYQPWQTSTSKRTTRLALNLWSGYCSDGETYIEDDGFEGELTSRFYAPSEIFSCDYAPFYWEAIKLRFPQYVSD